MRFNHHGGVGEFSDLPGCSQVCVSHSAFVPIEERGKGLGALAHRARLDLMRELAYEYAMCTIDSANTVQKNILVKNRWYMLDQFDSSKTGHRVEIYGRRV